jgi:hypothetical protein
LSCWYSKVSRKPQDSSADIIVQLCLPFAADALNDVAQLKNAMKARPLVKIPVSRIIPVGSGLGDSSFFEDRVDSEARLLVDRYVAFEDRTMEFKPGMSEEVVLACITEITGMMWRKLALCCGLTAVFDYNYNKKDSSGDTEGDARPDETDYLNNFMVCKSEHNDTDLAQAVEELTEKLSNYNVVEYGTKIAYLPVLAAAGQSVEFGLVDVRTRIYHLAVRYDLRDVGQRVRCFISSINVFRIIRTMEPFIPTNPTPLFKTQKNVTFVQHEVRKKILTSDTCPNELYDLLSTSSIPCAVRVVKQKHKLVITPSGCRIPNQGRGLSEDSVRRAVIAVLTCLVTLHGYGFVHRDIRWANLIRIYDFSAEGTVISESFLVIDFELASRIGNIVPCEDYINKDVVPHGRQFHARHDLCLVGKLVQTWAKENRIQLTDDDICEFVNITMREDHQLTAEEAFQTCWLK